MRTTLTIDDDIFFVLKTLATEQSTTIGKLISQLAKIGLKAKTTSYSTKNNFPVFDLPKNTKNVTIEDVKKAEEEN